jgi:serine acetyltransferase
MIMTGFNIGINKTIEASSFDTKSTPNGKIAAGNPARIEGDTKHFVEKIKQYDVGSKGMSYDEKKRCLLSLGDDKFIKK